MKTNDRLIKENVETSSSAFAKTFKDYEETDVYAGCMSKERPRVTSPGVKFFAVTSRYISTSTVWRTVHESLHSRITAKKNKTTTLLRENNNKTICPVEVSYFGLNQNVTGWYLHPWLCVVSTVKRGEGSAGDTVNCQPAWLPRNSAGGKNPPGYLRTILWPVNLLT